MDNNSGKVNCLKCKYYQVTWNPKAPNGCRLLGFKSEAMPSAVAYETTGKLCEGFTRKDSQKPNVKGAKDADAESGVIVSIRDKDGRGK